MSANTESINAAISNALSAADSLMKEKGILIISSHRQEMEFLVVIP